MAFSTVKARVTVGASPKVSSSRSQAPTLAAARTALASKLKIQSGTVLGVSESEGVASTGYVMGTGEFEDLALTLSKSGLPDRVLIIANVKTSYMLAGDKQGRVDIANADIIAIGTTYYDADGLTGWGVTGGKFQS